MGSVQVRGRVRSIAYQSDMRVGGYDPQEHDHGELWPGTTESMGRQTKKQQANNKRSADGESSSRSHKHPSVSEAAAQVPSASGGRLF